MEALVRWNRLLVEARSDSSKEADLIEEARSVSARLARWNSDQRALLEFENVHNFIREEEERS